MFLVKLIHDEIQYPGVIDAHTHVGFYPSSASVEYEDADGDKNVIGKCLRQQFYSYCGVPKTEPLSPDTLIKFELGNVIHEMVVERVKRSGRWLGDEVRMFNPGPPPISGRADLFLTDPRDNAPVGCEIKTISGYNAIKKVIKGPDARPKKDHVLQCVPYLDFYGQFGLVRWILLYVDRESGAMAEYVLMLETDGSVNIQGKDFAEIDRNLTVRGVNERWLKLMDYIDKGELPPRDYTLQWSNKQILKKKENGELTKTDTKAVDKKIGAGKLDKPLLAKGDWQCNYCDWKTLCYSNNPEPKEVPPMPNPLAIDPTKIVKKKARKVTDVVKNEEMF